MNNKQGLITAIYVDYWSGNDRPYRNMLHEEGTDTGPQVNALEAAFALAGVQDGDEVEIVVRRTGRRPFGDRRYRHVRPHAYERETEQEAAERRERTEEPAC